MKRLTMKKLARPIVVLLLLSGVAVFGVQAGKKSVEAPVPDKYGIEWYNYEAGWEKAKAENKHLFVDFTAVWCVWCKRLEANTFSQDSIKKTLTEDFVPVKIWEKDTSTLDIDGYTISTKDLRTREFGVRSYPTMWFVSPKGVRIGPVSGYVDANQMAQFLDIVKNYRYDTTLDESGNPKK